LLSEKKIHQHKVQSVPFHKSVNGTKVKINNETNSADLTIYCISEQFYK